MNYHLYQMFDSVCSVTSLQNESRKVNWVKHSCFVSSFKSRITPAERRWVLEATRDTSAGLLGGIISLYSTHPLDTAKVKMQTFPSQYKTMYSSLTQTFKSHGIRGLYSGSVPALWVSIIDNCVTFLMYGRISSWLQKRTEVASHGELTLFQKASCGAFTGAVSAFFINPCELIKCRLQTQFLAGHSQKGSPTTFRSMGLYIIKSEGPITDPFRLMRGLTPTLIRKSLGYFFMFGGYEGSWLVLGAPDEGVKPPMWKSFIAGGIGGVCSWLFPFPFDGIKSRMQVDTLGLTTLSSAGKDVFKAYGMKGFYRGLSPCLMRAFPGCGILFLVRDQTEAMFNRYFNFS